MTMENEDAAKVLRGVLSLARRLRAERSDGAASPAAISLLAALYRLGPVTAVHLAADQRLQPQSLTRLIAALEAKSLISRKPSQVDGRERIIELTRRGAGVFAADMRNRQRWLEAAMAGTLTAREKAALVEAAEALTKLANYDPDEAVGAGPAGATRARPSGLVR